MRPVETRWMGGTSGNPVCNRNRPDNPPPDPPTPQQSSQHNNDHSSPPLTPPTPQQTSQHNIHYEKAAVLFNLAAVLRWGGGGGAKRLARYKLHDYKPGGGV